MTQTDTETIERLQHQPPYHVILLDDNDHSYGFVIDMLTKIFGYPLEKGYQMAKEVDTTGRCIVFTGSLETAEFKRDQIHSFGANWRTDTCQGPMSAILEPAEG